MELDYTSVPKDWPLLESVWFEEVIFRCMNVNWLVSWKFGYIITLTTEILKKELTSRKS